MKTIGLIGGMSWESTAQYYAIINRTVRARLGPPHSARIVLDSFDFAEIEALQHSGNWDALGDMLAASACKMEGAGAELIVLATNTMHKLAGRIERACTAPLLHIADPTGSAIRADGMRPVGLLGTAFTMEQPFYRERLAARHGLEVLIPEAADRALVHRIIYDELVAGDVRDDSRAAYRAVIARLAERGAEAIILGCTEIMLLVGADDSPVPIFDTTRLHAEVAALWALGETEGA